MNHQDAKHTRISLCAGVVVLCALAGAEDKKPPQYFDIRRADLNNTPEEVISPSVAPVDPAATRQADLVELGGLDPALRLDIRYATPNNFTGRAVCRAARAFLQRTAEEALLRALQKLKAQGYGLLVFDGYRPWSVTKLFWEVTPPGKKLYVAVPAEGSRHNRGCAVDLTLFDLKTGQEVSMPSAFDTMGPTAHSNYAGGTAEQRRLRKVLRDAMEAEGFTVNTTEWWHFDYKDWRKYPILDVPFEGLGPVQGTQSRQ